MPEQRKQTPQPTSAEKVVDILVRFATTDGTLSVREIAHAFGLSRSSAYRYLQVLRERRLIEETPAAGTFRLGPGLLRFHHRLDRGRDLAAVAKPFLARLAAQSRETVLLTRCRNGRVAVLDWVDSPQVVRVAVDAARDRSLLTGSFARLHLAYMPEAERAAVLEVLPRAGADAGAVDRERLIAELDEIRLSGLARSEGEIEQGMCSVAVPVGMDGAMPIAALAVAGPSFRLRKELTGLIPLLRETAAALAAAWQVDCGSAGLAPDEPPLRQTGS